MTGCPVGSGMRAKFELARKPGGQAYPGVYQIGEV